MKTFISKLGLLLLLIIFTGCSKEDEIQFENPMEHIGQQHNQALKIILSNYGDVPAGINEITKKTEQIIRTNSDLQALFNVDLSSPDLIFEYPDANTDGEIDLVAWVNAMAISNDLKISILETFTILEASGSLAKIISNIEDKEMNAADRFTGEELNTYYAHLAVAKYSASFWSAEAEGGENGIKYLNLNDGKAHEIDWIHVYQADCVGSVLGGAPGASYMSTAALMSELDK